VDGRSHKPDSQHSLADPVVEVQLKLLVDGLQRRPDTWSAALLDDTAAMDSLEELQDYGENPANIPAALSSLLAAPAAADTSGGGDPANCTGDEDNSAAAPHLTSPPAAGAWRQSSSDPDEVGAAQVAPPAAAAQGVGPEGMADVQPAAAAGLGSGGSSRGTALLGPSVDTTLWTTQHGAALPRSWCARPRTPSA
jgi:hypothetical protein